MRSTYEDLVYSVDGSLIVYDNYGTRRDETYLWSGEMFDVEGFVCGGHNVRNYEDKGISRCFKFINGFPRDGLENYLNHGVIKIVSSFGGFHGYRKVLRRLS